MAALKTVVIVMGLLIVAGVAVVALAIMGRSSGPDPVEDAFAPVSLGLPADCRIVGSHLEEGRLVLVMDGAADACRRAEVLDAATGRRLGSVRLGLEGAGQ